MKHDDRQGRALPFSDSARFLERDADQSSAPADLITYILRSREEVVHGVLIGIEVDELGRPALKGAGDFSSRPPRYEGEVSRVFLADNVVVSADILALTVGDVTPERSAGS